MPKANKVYDQAIEKFFTLLMPSSPPSITVKSGLFGERETQESKDRTKEWEIREKIKSDLLREIHDALKALPRK